MSSHYDHEEEAKSQVVLVQVSDAAQSSGTATGHNLIDDSAQMHLDVDSGDGDSALGGMTPQTSTISTQSSIYKYVEENGRTYHRYKEGKYLLPNVEAEKDRLDLQHHLWMMTLDDELVLAPINKNDEDARVLDIGTGIGIWGH